MATNPLLQIHFLIPFDQIGPEDMEPAADLLLKDCRERLDALISAPEERTFANTMDVLDHLTERLEYAVSIIRHLESVATTPELRRSHEAVQPKVSAFY